MTKLTHPKLQKDRLYSLGIDREGGRSIRDGNYLGFHEGEHVFVSSMYGEIAYVFAPSKGLVTDGRTITNSQKPITLRTKGEMMQNDAELLGKLESSLSEGLTGARR